MASKSVRLLSFFLFSFLIAEGVANCKGHSAPFLCVPIFPVGAAGERNYVFVSPRNLHRLVN